MSKHYHGRRWLLLHPLAEQSWRTQCGAATRRAEMASSRCPSLARACVPDEVEHWSMTTLRDKLIKIGTDVVRHSRCVTFQLAEVAISRRLFAEILRLIDGLRPKPAPT